MPPQTRPEQPRNPRRGRPHRTSNPRTDPARLAAYDVLRAVDDRDAYANLLLPAVLTERGLAGRDAAFATELTYGTLRGRGTYDAILAACSDRDQLDPPVRDVLRLGAHQLLATRVGRHAAVATSVDLAKDVCGPRPSGFVNAVLRRVATRDLDAWTELVAPRRDQDLVGHLAVRYSYPRWIVEALRDALGPAATAELDDALAAGSLRPEVTLAVTPGHDRTELAVPDATPTQWSPYGLRLAGGDPSPYLAGGQAAVQDEASQLAALALTRVTLGPGRPDANLATHPDASPDRYWLDLCAGPGGKARLLAALAGQRDARLLASDVRRPRAARILAALRRAGLAATPNAATPNAATPNAATPNAATQDAATHDSAVIAADGLRPAWPSATFDRVLADVPCSNLGSLRRRPEARWRKRPGDVPELAAVQRKLLDAAIDSVRPGGVVAYVTCSPHLAETRDVVTGVAAGRADVTILDAPAMLPEVPGLAAGDPRFAQFWPHRHGTDAIFLALLQRSEPAAPDSNV